MSLVDLILKQVGGIVKSKIPQKVNTQTNSGMFFFTIFLMSIIILFIEAYIVYFIFNSFAPNLYQRLWESKESLESIQQRIQIHYIEALAIVLFFHVLFR